MAERQRGPTGRWLWVVVLLGLAVGLAIRWEGYDTATEYAVWTVDGMRYLRHAREAMDGWPKGIDPLRRIGDGVEWKYPLSLLPAATAWVAQATGWSPATIGGHMNLVLVPVLGALCAWAALALGTGWAGAAAAAAVSMAWLPMADRSGQWRMDTDLGVMCLVVALGVCAWYTRAAETRTGRLSAWAGWALSAVLLWWWWDQARAGVGLLALAPLAAAVILVQGRHRAERWGMALAGLAITGAMVWLSPREGGVDLGSWVGAVLRGEIPGEEPEWSAAMGLGSTRVSELLSKPHWGWWVTLPALVLLIPGRWRALAVIAGIPAALAVGASWMGIRWLMAWGPVVGWTVGAIAAVPARYAGTAAAWVATVVALAQLALWAAALTMAEKRPGQSPDKIEAWQVLETTPVETVVVAMWDEGSGIRAQAQRATISDASHPNTKRQAVSAAAWRTRTEKGAWAVMRLQVARGTEGLLATGAGETSEPERLRRALRRLDMPLAEAAEELAQAAGTPCETKESCLRWLRPDPGRPLVAWVDARGRTAYERWALTWMAVRGRSQSGCFARLWAGEGQDGTTLWRLADRAAENAGPGACRGRVTEPR